MHKLYISALILAGVILFGCGKESPVPKVVPEQIVMDIGDSTMAIGSVNVLEAIVLPENSDDKTLLWSSTDPTVVSVDGNGRITGLKEGTSFITAKAKLGGVSSTRQVTVLRDEDRISGWLEIITIPSHSFMAMEVHVANASNKPMHVKKVELHNGIYLLDPGPHFPSVEIAAQSTSNIYTFDSNSNYLDGAHVKVYFMLNNKNYLLTMHHDGSWRTDPVNDFSIGIDPEWKDETSVDLPKP
jgi:hypothetical protein